MSKQDKKTIEANMHAGIKDDDPFAPHIVDPVGINKKLDAYYPEEEEVKISGGFLSTSQNTSNLFTAMLNVQREIKPAEKSSDNPYFKSKYADLHEVSEAIKEPALKHGILYMQFWTKTNPVGCVNIETLIAHPESGEWLKFESAMHVKDALNPQVIGSAITYAKRYSLSGIFALTSTEQSLDDDGNRAAGLKEAKQKVSDDTVVDGLLLEAKKGLEQYEIAHKKLTPEQRKMVSSKDRIALRKIANGNSGTTATQ